MTHHWTSRGYYVRIGYMIDLDVVLIEDGAALVILLELERSPDLS